jgi:hypothetical protein
VEKGKWKRGIDRIAVAKGKTRNGERETRDQRNREAEEQGAGGNGKREHG